MILSVLLYGFLFATLMAALFHLWRDGGLGKLILYLLASWAGFLAGAPGSECVEGIHILDIGNSILAALPGS